jgi:ribosomal protein L13E
MYSKKENNRRYYLHRKLRKRGLAIDVRRKTIMDENFGPTQVDKYARELMSRFNYAIIVQIEIPS